MSKEYPQNSEEFSAYLDEVLATYGITVNPSLGRRLPKTKATGGTQFGVIMIPRTSRGLRATRSRRNRTSPSATP